MGTGRSRYRSWISPDMNFTYPMGETPSVITIPEGHEMVGGKLVKKRFQIPWQNVIVYGAVAAVIGAWLYKGRKQ